MRYVGTPCIWHAGPSEDANVRAARQGIVDAGGVGPSGRYRLRCVVESRVATRTRTRPICADFGSMPITTLAVQIRSVGPRAGRAGIAGYTSPSGACREIGSRPYFCTSMTLSGVMSQFFGEKARMMGGPAALAVQTGAALMPVIFGSRVITGACMSMQRYRCLPKVIASRRRRR
jgi:hypothetical protein